MVGDLYSQAFTNLGKVVASVPSGKAGKVEVTAASGKVENTGTIEANAPDGSGSVQMDAPAIVHKGTLAAQGGKVKLVSGGDILFQSDSIVNVSETEAGSPAGAIEVTAARIAQLGTIQADGTSGSGGNIDLHATDMLVVGGKSVTTANAGLQGDGGEVILVSQDALRVDSSAVIAARGGSESGNGGFVETSGLQSFDIGTSPDVSAPAGRGGTWLIDPNNVTIVAGAGNTNINATNPFISTNDTAQLGVNLITGALTGGANVVVSTATAGTNAEAGDITLATDLNFNGTLANNLTFNAHNDINLNGNITDSSPGGNDTLNLFLNADSDGLGNGTVNINRQITTGNGTLSIVGANVSITGAIDTGTANITITPSANNAVAVGTAIAGNFSITDANLDRITTSGTLRIGGATATSITVNNVTTPANITGTLALNTTGTALFTTNPTTLNAHLEVKAADVNITAAINVGAHHVALDTYSNTTNVGLGDTIGPAYNMIVSRTELQNITANELIIGLNSPQDITADNVTAGDLGNVTQVTLNAQRDIIFAGSASSFPALNATAQRFIPVWVNVTTTAGDLTLRAPSTTGDSLRFWAPVTLSSTGNLTLSANARIWADGDLTLMADSNRDGTGNFTVDRELRGNSVDFNITTNDFVLPGSGWLSTYGGDLILQPSTNKAVGVGTNVAGGFNIDDTELDRLVVYGGTLTIGGANAASITANNVTPLYLTGTLVLETPGTVSFTTNPTTLGAHLGVTAADVNITTTINVGNTHNVTFDTYGNTTSIGVGDATSNMTISRSEIQNITANTLVVGANNAQDVTANNVTGADLVNIRRVALNAQDDVIFSGNASTFPVLSAVAQDYVTVNANLTTTTGDLDLQSLNVSNDRLNFAAGITLNASDDLTLTSGGWMRAYGVLNLIAAADVTLAGSFYESSTGLITMTSTGPGDLVTQAIQTWGGNVILDFDNAILGGTGIINGAVTTGNGYFDARFTGDLTFGSTISTGTGDASLVSQSGDLNFTGTAYRTTSGRNISTSSGRDTILGANMDIDVTGTLRMVSAGSITMDPARVLQADGGIYLQGGVNGTLGRLDTSPANANITLRFIGGGDLWVQQITAGNGALTVQCEGAVDFNSWVNAGTVDATSTLTMTAYGTITTSIGDLSLVADGIVPLSGGDGSIHLNLRGNALTSAGNMTLKATAGSIQNATGLLSIGGGRLTLSSYNNLYVGQGGAGVSNINNPARIDLVASSTGPATDAVPANQPQVASQETQGLLVLDGSTTTRWKSLTGTGQAGIYVSMRQEAVNDILLIATQGDIRTAAVNTQQTYFPPVYSLGAGGTITLLAEDRTAAHQHTLGALDTAGADVICGTLEANGIIIRAGDKVFINQGTLDGNQTGSIFIQAPNLDSASGLIIEDAADVMLNLSSFILVRGGDFIIRNVIGRITSTAPVTANFTNLDWSTSYNGPSAIDIRNGARANLITLTASGASATINVAGNLDLSGATKTLTISQGGQLTFGAGGISPANITNSNQVDLVASSTNNAVRFTSAANWSTLQATGATGVLASAQQKTTAGLLKLIGTTGNVNATAALDAATALQLTAQSGDVIAANLTGGSVTLEAPNNNIRLNQSTIDAKGVGDVRMQAGALIGNQGLTIQNVAGVDLDITNAITISTGNFSITATGDIDATAPSLTTVSSGDLIWTTSNNVPGAINFSSNDLSARNIYLTASGTSGSIVNTDGTLSGFAGIVSLSQGASLTLGAAGSIRATEILNNATTDLILQSSAGTVTVTDPRTWNSLNITGQTGINIAASQAADDQSIFLTASAGFLDVNAPLLAGRNMTLRATGAGGAVRVGGTGNFTVGTKGGTGTLALIQNSGLTINASTNILNAMNTDFVPQSTGGTVTLSGTFTWNSLNATGQQGVSVAANQSTTQGTILTATTGSVSVNAALNSSRDMMLRAEGIGGTIQVLPNGSLRVGTDRTLTLSQYANLPINNTALNILNRTAVNLVAQSTGGEVQFNQDATTWNSLNATGQTGVTVTANQSTDNGDLLLTSTPGRITATGTTLTAAGGALVLQAGVDVLAGDLTGVGVSVAAGGAITLSSTIDGQSRTVYLQATRLTATTGLDIQDANYVDLRIGTLSVGSAAGGNFDIRTGITGAINASSTTAIVIGSGSTLNWSIDPSASGNIILAPGTSITDAGSIILSVPNGTITGAGNLGVASGGGLIQLTQAGSLSVGNDVGLTGTTSDINLNINSTRGAVAFNTNLNLNSVTATGQTGVTVNGNLTTDAGNISLTATTGNVTVGRNLNSGQAIVLGANTGSIDMANVALAANTDLFLSAPNSAINTTGTTLSFTGAGDHRYEVTQRGSMIIGGGSANLPVPATPAANIDLNVNSTAGTVTLGQAFTWNSLVVSGNTGITVSGNQTADSGNIGLTANTGNIALGNNSLNASLDMFLIAPRGAVTSPGNISFGGAGNHGFTLVQSGPIDIGSGLLNFTNPDVINLTANSTSGSANIGQAFTWNSLSVSANTGITVNGTQTTDAGDIRLATANNDINLNNSSLTSALGMFLRAPLGNITNTGGGVSLLTGTPAGNATYAIEQLGALNISGTGIFNVTAISDRIDMEAKSNSGTVTIARNFTWNSLNVAGQTGVIVLGPQTTDTGNLTITATTGAISGSNVAFNATGALTLLALDAGFPGNGDISAGNLTGLGITVRASDLITLSTVINPQGLSVILNGANLTGNSGLSIQNVNQVDLDINNNITLSGGSFTVNAGQIIASNSTTISVAAGGDLNWTATADIAGAINVAGTLTADNVSLLVTGATNSSIQGTGTLAVRNNGGDITVSQTANLTIGAGGLGIGGNADLNVTSRGGTLTLGSALNVNSLVASGNQGMTVQGNLTTVNGNLRLSTNTGNISLNSRNLTSASGMILSAPTGNITNIGTLTLTPAGPANFTIEHLGAIDSAVFNISAPDRLTTTLTSGNSNVTLRQNFTWDALNVTGQTGVLVLGSQTTDTGNLTLRATTGAINGSNYALNATGALTLVANAGNISAGALNATGNVSATTGTGSVTLAGDINAGNTVTVAANTNILTGNVTGNGAISVNSSTGSITAGNFSGNGTLSLLARGASQNITAGSLTGGEITLRAGNRISLSSTLDSAGQNVTLQGESLVASSSLTIPSAAQVNVDINTTIDIGGMGSFSINATGQIDAWNPTAITFTAGGGALNWTSQTGSINLSGGIITNADIVSLAAPLGNLSLPTNLTVNANGTISLTQNGGFNLTGRTVVGDNVTFSANTTSGDIIVDNGSGPINFTGRTPGFGAIAVQGNIILGPNFNLTDASRIQIEARNGAIAGNATLGVNSTGNPINLAQSGNFAFGATGINLTVSPGRNPALTVLAGSLNISNIANNLYALNLTVLNGNFDLKGNSLNVATDMALVANTGSLVGATGNLSIGDGRTLLIRQQGNLSIGGPGGINGIRDSSGDLDQVNLIVQSTGGNVALNVSALRSLIATAAGSINASGPLTAQNGTLTLNAGANIQAGSLTGQGIAVNAGAAGDIFLASTLNSTQDITFAGRNLNATTNGLNLTATGNIAFNNTGMVTVSGGNFTATGANITATSPSLITVQGANLTLSWQAMNGTIAAGNLTATGIALNAGSNGTIVLNSALDAEGSGVQFTALALNSTHGLDIRDSNGVSLNVQTMNVSGGNFTINTNITGDINASVSAVTVQGNNSLDWRTAGNISAGDLQAANVTLFTGANGTITLSSNVTAAGNVDFDGQTLRAVVDGLAINANLVDFHNIQTVTVGGGDLSITAATNISGTNTDITVNATSATLRATNINNLRSIRTGSDLTVQVSNTSYVRNGDTTLDAGRTLTLIGFFNIAGTLVLDGTSLDITRAIFGPNAIVDRPLMAQEILERDSYIAQVEGTNLQALLSLLALAVPGIQGLIDWSRAIPEAPELSQIQGVLNQLAGEETRISAEAVQTFDFYPSMRVGTSMLDRYSRLYIGEPLENLLKQLATLHGFLADAQHLTTLADQLEADLGKFDALVLTDPWLRQAREFLHLAPMFLLKTGQDPELAGQMLLNLCSKLKETHPNTYKAIEQMVKEELED
jgi:hypothetical protein